MNFFKPIHPTVNPDAKPELLAFLAPYATAALEQKATLWQVLAMLRTASIFLVFEKGRIVYMRRGWGRHAVLHPAEGTPPGDLLWHLLGSPQSVSAHDRALRDLAIDLAWYQVSNYIPHTPPEIIQIVHDYGPTLKPSLVYEIVKDDFAGMRSSAYFEDMLRMFKTSISDPTYIRSGNTFRSASQ